MSGNFVDNSSNTLIKTFQKQTKPFIKSQASLGLKCLAKNVHRKRFE